MASDPGTRGRYGLQDLKLGSGGASGLIGVVEAAGAVDSALEFVFVLVFVFVSVPPQPVSSNAESSMKAIAFRINESFLVSTAVGLRLAISIKIINICRSTLASRPGWIFQG